MDQDDVHGPSDAKRQKLDEPRCDSSLNIDTPEQIDKLGVDKQTESTDKEPSNVTDLGRVLTEEDVGITQYISSHDGFNGVIKQRYSDFLVNEISMDGRVVELTTTDLPAPDTVVQTQAVEISTDIICTEDIKQLEELAASKDTSKSVLIEVGDDKTVRTRVHRAIAEGFLGALDSATVSKDDKKFVEVKITTNKGSGLRRWPKQRGDYCRFVLYKENKDTMDTIGLIARQMGLKGGMFQYAGTKDKRAKTSQEVTVYRVQAEKLQNNNKRLRNIATGNYVYVKEPLKLGQLQGNKFTIILRSVSGSTNQIDEAMTSLRDVGFINYYGMQRFGTSTVPTHHIGRAMLLSDWKTAVELILQPRSTDVGEVDDARKHWWKTRNSSETLRKMPKHQFIERLVLEGLAEGGETNYLGAINKMARNTRLMYVHSYQSYVWNTVISERISKYGIKPVVGDQAVDGEVTDIDGENQSNMSKVKPVVVTEDTVDKYTIYDIVLPLPGFDVTYPDSVEDLYRALMANDGLDYQSMRHKIKDYSLSGAYRHMMIKPKSVNWSTYKYNDVSLPLALSDWDKLNGDKEPTSIEGGEHLALKMELSLPASCYATMAIREILKTDTSSAHQTTLNVI